MSYATLIENENINNLTNQASNFSFQLDKSDGLFFPGKYIYLLQLLNKHNIFFSLPTHSSLQRRTIIGHECQAANDFLNMESRIFNQPK